MPADCSVYLRVIQCLDEPVMAIEQDKLHENAHDGQRENKEQFKVLPPACSPSFIF